MKFGGGINSGSVADISRIGRHITYAVDDKRIPIIVLSAFGKGTKFLDALYHSVFESADSQNVAQVKYELSEFFEKHFTMLENLIRPASLRTVRKKAREKLEAMRLEAMTCVDDLAAMVAGSIDPDPCEKYRAKMLSFGERAAVEIVMVPYLETRYSVTLLNAEKLMIGDVREGVPFTDPEFDEKHSLGYLASTLIQYQTHICDPTRGISSKGRPPIMVMSGFIGGCPNEKSEMETVTFGFDGSDFTVLVLVYAIFQMLAEQGLSHEEYEACVASFGSSDPYVHAVLVKGIDFKQPLPESSFIEDLLEHLDITGSTLVGERALEYAVLNKIPFKISNIDDPGQGEIYYSRQRVDRLTSEN